MSKLKVLGMQNISSMCAVCGEDNPLSFDAHFYALEGDLLYATLAPKAEQQSYPGRMHGGLIAAVIDEMIGRAPNVTPERIGGEAPILWGVTGDLKTRYRKPTPYDMPLYAIARITKESRRFFEGEAFLYTEDGVLTAEGSARYMIYDPESIAEGGLSEKDWHADSSPCPEMVEIPTLPKPLD